MAVTFRLTQEQLAIIQPVVYLDRNGVVAGSERPSAAVAGAGRPAGTVVGSRRSQAVLLGRPRPSSTVEG